MNKISRLTALLLALMMIFSTFAAAETSYSVGGMTAEQWQQLVDNAESGLYTIDEGDSGSTVMPDIPAQPEHGDYYPYTDGTSTALIVSEDAASALRTESGVAVLTHAADGQWQMLVGDVWADLSGETGASLWVTPGMMHGLSSAEFRKALLPRDEAGEFTAFTQVAEVSVVSGLPATLSAVTRNDASTGDTSDEENAAAVYSLQRANESLQKHLITIEYRFQSNNEVAATPYYAEVSTTTSSFSAEVRHPNIVGYQPTDSAVSLDENGNIVALPAYFACSTTQVSITEAAIDGDVTIVVYYEPAEVKFTVNFWAEKAVYTIDPATGEEVKYDLIATEEFTGYTEAAVKESYPAGSAEQYFATLHSAAGFKALLYDENVKIAADGSTVVDVYYQRLYYLMVFNLSGGYGVNPVYARHGAPVGTIGTPTRPGYTHKGWTLDPDKTVYTDGYSDFATIPDTVPIGNVTYYAVWESQEVTFRVTYWLEDPNWDGVDAQSRYLYWGSLEKTALTGSTVYATDYESYSEIEGELDTYEKRYSTYNEELTDQEDGDGIQVAGDGSTVLNVFYDRKEYTLRFYYAMSTTNDQDVTTYYVVGGSTYYFGTYNTSNTDDPVKRIDPYMGQGSYKDERGKVDAEPTLNERGLSRNYEKGSESSTVADVDYDYHYIQFKAKYGQDISDMWPADVFNSVPYTGTKGNGWSGDQAFVSAWNGEYNVYYSHHASGGNQTIKGNYAELDYQLLWDQDCGVRDHPDEDSELVSYLCFWENGADRGWNVPELYRYNVYVPVFDGDDLNDPTNREYGGVTYKLRESYNTVDNSTVEEQTAPAISGLRYVEREGVRITDYDKSLYNEAWDVFFYYSRDIYDLTFSNYDAGIEIKSHVYEEDISEYNSYEPENPPSYPEGTYVFGGWYTSPEMQDEARYTFDTMPANDVILYAKWTPIKHSVRVYNTKEDADKAIAGETVGHLYEWIDKVSHGSPVASAYDYGNKDQYDPETQEFPQPTRPGYNFALWYYYAPDGTAQPFSFNNTPITQDTFVFAEWTADTLATYTIYFVQSGTAADEVDNPDNWVAEPIYGSGLAGAATTERAKGGTELYEAFQTGYFPTLESHSFTLDVDPTRNVYVFEYVKADNVPYKVQYVTKDEPDTHLGTILIDGETYYMLEDTKSVLENDKAVVTEDYVQVGGNYVPDAFQKRLVLRQGTTIEENVIVFYYTKEMTSTTLEVNHILVHADGSETTHDSVKQIVNDLPEEITVETITVPYYAYDQDRSERFDGTSTTNTFSGLSFTLEYGAAGAKINLYYVEETVTINYVAVGPADATDFGTVTPETETVGKVTGTPGSTAAAGAGYKFVGWYSDAACTVRVGADAAFAPEKVNGVHVAATYYARFEYLPGQLDITKVVVNNTEEDIQQTEFTFNVTLTDVNGHPLAGNVEYLIGGQTYTAALQEGKFSLTLDVGTVTGTTTRASATASIADLPYGVQYVVTETPVDNCSVTVENDSGSIRAAETVTATITNTFPAATVSSLKITKNGMSNGESAVFKVELETGTYMLVLNSANPSETILNVPIDSTYTVTELDKWSWRYDDAGAQSGTIQRKDNNVEFTNSRTNTQWMSDESCVVNNVTEGKQIDGLNNQ